MSDNAGKPARAFGRFVKREVIGHPDCPLLHRWTLLGEPTWPGTWPFKLMVHRFLPNADDRDVHDHPRPFVTIVLAGSYDDYVPSYLNYDAGSYRECGVHRGDRMRPGTIRFRAAAYRHRTRVGPRGCVTVVLMGPKRREWGFWKDGSWWPWREYEKRFGHGMRCE